jgi:membrane-associated phospholipid phosphatase
MTRKQMPNRRLNETALTWRASTMVNDQTAPRALPQRPRIAKALRDECAAIWAACGPFEWIAFAYLALSSALIAIFAENLPHPIRLLVTRACVVALILLLCRGTEISVGDESELRTYTQKIWHFWRHWYPHLFFLFCFEELAQLVHLISPRWQDVKLIAFDFWLTGVHPSIWLEQFNTPARNDFMQFTYITYFTYLLVLGGILYYRKDWRGYWSVMTYSAVAYAIGYIIAISFPVQSPWFSMAGSWHGDLRGGPFTALINYIEHYGRVRGAAFPSEHVAGSFAALWGAWRHRRWLSWVMLPLVLCMCASTIWGRYHYVADIFGGIATGTLGYLIGGWIMRRNSNHAERAM